MLPTSFRAVKKRTHAVAGLPPSRPPSFLYMLHLMAKAEYPTLTAGRADLSQ